MTGRAGVRLAPGISILHPPAAPLVGTTSDVNNNSIVCRVEFGEVSFLFTGDLDFEGQAYLLGQGVRLTADVLKYPHHGSRLAFNPSFLAAVSPRVCVISVGPNPFGQPACRVGLPAGAGVAPINGPRCGAVVTDGRSLRVIPARRNLFWGKDSREANRLGYEQVQQDLKEGSSPCLPADGPEDYLKQALKSIVEGCSGPGGRQHSHRGTREPRQSSPPPWRRYFKFMGRHGAGVEEMEDGEQEALALSLPELPAGYLVLTAAKLDRGRKLYRTVTKLGKVYRFDHLTGLGLQRWVETRAAQLGLKLPPGAVRELTGIEDLSYLDTELAKMALYHPGGALSQEEFDQLFFPGQGEDNKRIFAFVDAVGMKNTAQALSHLDGLWGLGYDYARIFGMLVRQIRLLIMAARAGGRPEVLVGQHKLNSFVAKKVCRQSVNFSSRELRQAMALLLKTDQAVKTGMPPGLPRGFSRESDQIKTPRISDGVFLSLTGERS